MCVGVVVLSVVEAGTGWVDTGATVGGMVGVVAELEVPAVDAAADDDGVVSNGVPAAVVAAGGVGTAMKYDLICIKIIFLNE